MIWFIIFLLILILAYKSDDARRYPRKKTLFFRWCLIIVLSLISAIGSPTGQDHENYSLIYRSVSTSNIFDFSTYDHYEPGYTLLNGVCRLLGIPEATFFLLISLFINWAVISFVFRYKYPVFNIAFFFIGGFLIQQGNIVRQVLASSIFIYAIQYLEMRNIKKYIISIVIAGLCHYTALFFLILSPLCVINLDKHSRILKIVMLAVLGMSTLIGLGYVSLPMSDMIQMASYYGDYLDTEEGIGMKLSPIRVVFYVLIAFALTMYAERKYYKLVFIVVLYAMVLNISLIIPNLARMVSYFDIVSTTLLLHCLEGDVLKIRFNKFVPVIKTGLVAVIAYLFFSQFIFANEVLLCSKTYTLSDFLF